MKSEWKVTANVFNHDEKQYQVYRLIDKDAVDHNGNREYAARLFANSEDAQELADRLNKEEKTCWQQRCQEEECSTKSRNSG